MPHDEYTAEAMRAILDRGRASPVVLQRALGIGWSRACRILDQLTEAQLLGPDTPVGAREIRFTADCLPPKDVPGCPPAYGGCPCECHSLPTVVHVMPCCHPPQDAA